MATIVHNDARAISRQKPAAQGAKSKQRSADVTGEMRVTFCRLQFIDRTADKIESVYNNGTITLSNQYVADFSSAVITLAEVELNDFQASCQVLMKTLDFVAAVHPFAGGSSQSNLRSI